MLADCAGPLRWGSLGSQSRQHRAAAAGLHPRAEHVGSALRALTQQQVAAALGAGPQGFPVSSGSRSWCLAAREEESYLGLHQACMQQSDRVVSVAAGNLRTGIQGATSNFMRPACWQA